jgi:hypothetical protein
VTFYLIFCPSCGHCYPREEDAHTLPCDHSMSGAVKMRRETVGRYEIVTMNIRNSSQAKGTVMPDGNGSKLVLHRRKGYKKESVISLDTFLSLLEQRNPALHAAFEARRDVRRISYRNRENYR